MKGRKDLNYESQRGYRRTEAKGVCPLGEIAAQGGAFPSRNLDKSGKNYGLRWVVADSARGVCGRGIVDCMCGGVGFGGIAGMWR